MLIISAQVWLNQLKLVRSKSRSNEEHAQAVRGRTGREQGESKSLGYPLQPGQTLTQDSSNVFDEHKNRQRITENRRTPHDQDFNLSRDNLGPSPVSIVICIKVKCLSQPIRTEINKGPACDKPARVQYKYIAMLLSNPNFEGP
jgi:hypothetical protein